MSKKKGKKGRRKRTPPPTDIPAPRVGIEGTNEEVVPKAPITFRDYARQIHRHGRLTESEAKRLFEPHQGNRVVWEGYVESVYGFSLTDNLALVMRPGTWAKEVRATCLFPPDVREDLFALKDGQRVLVRWRDGKPGRIPRLPGQVQADGGSTSRKAEGPQT